MEHAHSLLISLETIRRDHFRCHGYPRDLAPHLERLARGGVRFNHCPSRLPSGLALDGLAGSVQVAPTVVGILG